MTKLRQRTSYPQVRVVGTLLILQGFGLMGIGFYFISYIDWDRALVFTNEQGQIHLQTIEGPWLKPLEQAVLFAIFFLPPAVLLLLAGLSFLVRRRGWLLATTAQSLILLVCLFA
jgi:hypothetical protein